MNQKALLLRENPKEDISDEILSKCSTFKESLKLCKSVSGLDDKQIAMELNIDAGQWSRIWSNNAHFPDEKLTPYMNICGNIIPLRWLALAYGYELKPLKTSLEIELEKAKVEKLELEKKLQYFEELWKKK